MSLFLPASIAAIIITGRSLASSSHRMPYPYELASMAIIYAGAGLLGEASPELGTAVAWGYLVALILTPSSVDLLNIVQGGVAKRGSAPSLGAPTPQGGVA